MSLRPIPPRIHLLSTFSHVLLHLYTHNLRREVLRARLKFNIDLRLSRPDRIVKLNFNKSASRGLRSSGQLRSPVTASQLGRYPSNERWWVDGSSLMLLHPYELTCLPSLLASCRTDCNLSRTPGTQSAIRRAVISGK